MPCRMQVLGDDLMSELSDKTAIVVGASRGLGRSIATARAEAGASVVAVARTTVGSLQSSPTEPDVSSQRSPTVVTPRWPPASRPRRLGFTDLVIESDRFAEPFYLAMGAERIGATPSPVDGARLPILKIDLAEP